MSTHFSQIFSRMFLRSATLALLVLALAAPAAAQGETEEITILLRPVGSPATWSTALCPIAQPSPISISRWLAGISTRWSIQHLPWIFTPRARSQRAVSVLARAEMTIPWHGVGVFRRREEGGAAAPDAALGCHRPRCV